MTCNCKTELEAKLLDHYKARLPNSSEHSVTLEGYAMALTDTAVILKGVMPVSVKHTVTAKSGRVTRKSEKSTMAFSFCPFCGVKCD